MRSYFDGLLRYFEFSGRSTRMQYWMFALFSTLLGVGAVFADRYVNGVPLDGRSWGPLLVFVSLVHAIPGITITVRRLHDIGRSGWWYFITLIPIIGSIVLLVWMCWPSDDYANDYGEHPHDAQPASRQRQAYSTIPRTVRMGSNAARPPSIGRSGLAEPERFI
jgi:uncharacterized membrane protein YhaH (DUF805 family)